MSESRTVVVDRDALGSIRNELVEAARRRIHTRRRRRRGLAAIAASLALVSSSAAAATLTDYSTGVKPIDRLLDNISQSPETSSPQDQPTEMPPSVLRDVRPGAGLASEPLRIPWENAEGVAVAYLTRDNEVCSAMAAVTPGSGDSAPVGAGGGCFPPDILSSMVDRRGGVCCGLIGGPERRILDGYVRKDAVEVRLPSVRGTVDVRLSEPWTPPVPGGSPVRYFVAVITTASPGDVTSLTPEQVTEGGRIPPIEIEFDDGHVTRVER